MKNDTKRTIEERKQGNQQRTQPREPNKNKTTGNKERHQGHQRKTKPRKTTKNTTKGTNKKAVNTVYNVAFGNRNTLNDLIGYLKECLAEFEPKISSVEVKYGPHRDGDIPHSHASVNKAKKLLGYNPKFSLQEGLKETIGWYWKNL